MQPQPSSERQIGKNIEVGIFRGKEVIKSAVEVLIFRWVRWSRDWHLQCCGDWIALALDQLAMSAPKGSEISQGRTCCVKNLPQMRNNGMTKLVIGR